MYKLQITVTQISAAHTITATPNRASPTKPTCCAMPGTLRDFPTPPDAATFVAALSTVKNHNRRMVMHEHRAPRVYFIN
jgi:hypothetical protein